MRLSTIRGWYDLGVEVIVLEQLLDDGLLIGGVVDGEIAAEADVVGLAPQQARAQARGTSTPTSRGNRSSSRRSTRSRISWAALFVKVTAMI